MKTNKILCVILALCLLASAGLALVSCDGGDDPADTTTASANNTTAPSSDTTVPSSDTTAAGGDVKTEDLFVFEKDTYQGEEFCYITGMTELGKAQTSLDIPATLDGAPVVGLEKECFAGCDKLETLTVHSNIVEWYGKLFTGCSKLTKIYMDYSDFVAAVEKDTTVGDDFSAAQAFDGSLFGTNSILEGMNESVKFVFTDAKTYDFFSANYFWAIYSDAFVTEY